MNKGQTDVDLRNYCRIMQIRLDDIDLIQDCDFKNVYYILNLTPNQQTVGHWISLVNLSRSLFYFDPFGFRPPNNIVKYAKDNNKKLYVSKFQIQKLSESICGFYCCLFLLLMQKIEPKTEEQFKYLLSELAGYEFEFPK